MGADLGDFTLFMETLGKMHEIWIICWKIQVFFADGQQSENMEVYWMNLQQISCNSLGFVGELSEFCMICCNFDQKSDLKN